MMQGRWGRGQILALVIIMLSALEEQVSGIYFFGGFNYLKMIKKNCYSETF